MRNNKNVFVPWTFFQKQKKSIVAVSAAGGFLLQFAWACQLANAPWAVSLSRCQIEADAVMLRACEFWGFSFQKKKDFWGFSNRNWPTTCISKNRPCSQAATQESLQGITITTAGSLNSARFITSREERARPLFGPPPAANYS